MIGARRIKDFAVKPQSDRTVEGRPLLVLAPGFGDGVCWLPRTGRAAAGHFPTRLISPWSPRRSCPPDAAVLDDAGLLRIRRDLGAGLVSGNSVRAVACCLLSDVMWDIQIMPGSPCAPRSAQRTSTRLSACLKPVFRRLKRPACLTCVRGR